jgi:hypothetical protein
MSQLRHGILTLVACSAALAQTKPAYLQEILKQEILPPEVAQYQLRQYILKRIARLEAPSSLAQWNGESKRLREHILTDVVFHGWPKEWVDAPAKFEDLGVIPGNGYQMRKLRYEIVPGFQATAILYEPLNLRGKVPAILNTNGHVGPPGKSIEYKQKRCITFARNGILALNLEWLAYGELGHEWNQHWYGAHLDLVGTHELGLFYLAMRKGLDYLYNHPNTDRARLGMTGLSGGGWQTIVLSSLDERVRVAVPVAGFSSFVPRVEAKKFGDIGDVEQSATDLFNGRDYPWLTALMAPRPTLLIYNAEDDACFRSTAVKPGVYDAVAPFFTLYGKRDDFEWHENQDPGTHNYQIDNRTAAYGFFSRHFHLPPIQEDPAIASEVRSYEDLAVGLPADNLTIVGLARKLADQVRREPVSTDPSELDRERAALRKIIRYHPATIDRAWITAVTKHLGVETEARLFNMEDGLSSNGIWLKSIDAPGTAATIVLDDQGRSNSAVYAAARANRGEQVLAVDLPFHGKSWHQDTTWMFEPTWLLEQNLYATGDRPLGIEVAHLIALANWLKHQGAGQNRLETTGIRNQVVALVTSALEPSLFSEILIRGGMPSLRYLLDKPANYAEAPDLFCLDLYKFTDLDRLAALSAPTTVKYPLPKAQP